MNNDSETSGYADGENNVKAIHTRSGHIVKFTEDESIIITDKIGNEIQLDTIGGNINITAPKVITMNATDIIMNASQNISVTAGMNITESAGGDKTTTVGLMHSLSVGVDYMVNVTGKLFEMVIGERKSQAKKAVNNHESHEMNVEKNKDIHTEGEFKINSTEKSNMF
nr:hypothetical protein [uncultured Flavobacterium sp.]